MQQLDTIDMEKASDFLDVAATLLEIKSNSLLPKLEDMMPDEDDPKQKFIRLLEEYNMIQNAGVKLKDMENVNRFYKEPDDSVGNIRVFFTDFNLDGLLNAFSKMMLKVYEKRRDIEIPKEIQKERFTLPQKIYLIKTALMENKTLMFTELFDEDCSKGEIITTFLALLEILKEQFAGAKQQDIYGDIEIFIKEQEEQNE